MAHTLRFRATNRDIWTAIKSGKKKVETRAATSRYRKIEVGDRVVLVCGSSRFTKKISKVRIFKSVRGLTRVYNPQSINPACRTIKELEAMYFSFPGYREKIKKHGIIALELK
ncbi:MAG: hypothetical protein V1885_00470 [Candidatus Brennerbacteria bacterium]